MARMVVTGFLQPDAGETWCAVCTGMAKGAMFEDPAVQERVKKGLEDDKREFFVVAVPEELRKSMPLNAAVTWASNPHFGSAVVPLCFLHCTAISGDAPPPPKQQLLRGLS
jgi:hypothetical protein